MNNSKWLTTSVIGMLMGVAAGWWWARHSVTPPASPAAAAVESAAKLKERKILYWQDPMAPGQRFDKPGKSPFMDMQLEPVYAEESDGDAAVRVSGNVVQNLGIRLGSVRRVPVPRRLVAVGSIAFDEHLLEVIQARVAGYTVRLHVKTASTRVRRGDPLADVASPDWQQAQQEYLALLGDQSGEVAMLKDAARRRLLIMGIPEGAVRQLERDRTVSPTVTLTAPADGVVTELGIREGGAFTPGTTLFRINGSESVWINAAIPESQRQLIPLSSKVLVTATAWPGAQFSGRLESLLPGMDPASRTFTARAVVNNADGRLSPGMFVTLDLTSPPAAPQLIVPSEAVITSGRRRVVIVSHHADRFGVANVITGEEFDGSTVILKGLTEGQSVVLSGQFLIDSEASLTEAVERLNSAPTEGKQP